MENFTRLQKKAITLSLIVGPFLSGVGIDLYVPSLPIITNQFHVLQQFVQLTISVYLLGTATGQFFLGSLSDTFGRKKIIIWSSLCYIFISIGCSFSPNILALNLGRFLQGLCLGGILVSCRAIATDCFSGLNLNKAMTLFSISWGIGPIVGPFLGGYLQFLWNWQANFYFFAISGCLILLVSLLLPETNQNLVPFNFSKRMKGIKYISSHPIFLFNIIILTFLYSILVIFNVTGPFLIQVVLKYSVVAFGHMALLLGVGYFLGSVLNRFLIHRFNPISLALWGIIGSLVMSVLMIGLDVLIPMNIYTILIPTFWLFFLCGINYPNITVKVLSLFPKSAGTASALMGSLVTLGTFALTGIAALLKTDSQLPTSLTYAGIMLISLFLFCRFNEPLA